MDGSLPLAAEMLALAWTELSPNSLGLMGGTEKDHDTGKNGKSRRSGRAIA